MSNLISRLPYQKPEDTTTEVLAYLLQEFPSCRSAFLSLVGAPANSGDCVIDTQYPITDGKPDLVLHDNGKQWIVLIENKPWWHSSFTSKHEESDQLKRYAKVLQESEFQKRTLCLLATEYNSSRLLEEAQLIPDNGITFVVITWEQVFTKLASVCSENPAASFLYKELSEWMPPLMSLREVVVPPEVLQDEEKIRENWAEITTIIRQARDIASDDPSLGGYQFHGSGSNPKPNAESMNYFGCYVYEKSSGLPYFFGARMDARRFLGGQSLFVLQVRKGWKNLSGEKLTINAGALNKCGFKYEELSRSNPWACEYVCPLTDSSKSSATNPEELAKALAKILREVSEEINKSKS